MTATTIDTAPQARTARRNRFYLWMAVAMAATAFLGFAPTFWIPMAQGVPERIAVIGIHGALFFGWTLFLIYQAWLVTSGNVARHRDFGIIGVSLATAMTIFGFLAAINASHARGCAEFWRGRRSFPDRAGVRAAGLRSARDRGDHQHATRRVA